VGLPSGVFNLIHGTGPRTGQSILEHKDISAISFTGGTVTGGMVASVAGRTFKKLSLELGGKNPNVIFAGKIFADNIPNFSISISINFFIDCDLDRAIETTLRSSFANSGQICLCGSRILVEDDIYDTFLERFVAKVKSSIVVGPPTHSTTTMGPVISGPHRQKIEKMIATAVEQGGKVVCGGKRPVGDWQGVETGYYLEPTIIVDLDQHCQAIQEEIFGPVVTISRFHGYEQALAMANGVKYGLSATVWTSNLEKAHRFAQNLESGMVWVNNWLVRDLSTPFGGVKDSGVGREGGRYSLEFFSESKNIYIHLPPLIVSGASTGQTTPAADQSVKTRTLLTSVAPFPPAAPNNNNNTNTKTEAVSNLASPSASDKERVLDQNIVPKGIIDVAAAPKPVGAYPHARRVDDFLFLSGIGPRTPGTNAIPGGPIRDPTTKAPLNYDVKAQTRQVVENIRTVLKGCGASLEDIIDVQVYLVDMDRDFADFNGVYAEYFSNIQATRTTIAINALPTPIGVEFKVVALHPDAKNKNNNNNTKTEFVANLASPSASDKERLNSNENKSVSKGIIDVTSAPKPVGAYPHARRVDDFLFLSGIGPRTPGTNAIPGGPIRDPTTKAPLNYDVKAQTRQVVENIRTVLKGCGASLEDIIDVQVYLVDMDRDFADFNGVYAEYFSNIQATRTTIAINALPTPIGVEFKVVALHPDAKNKSKK
jgi:reactive intermediate/imine deaminase